ncbi:YqxA family protein [Heyndrickxia sp. NPDC080065]|uniref:YqxA family protein n=1 Tax=Heyndrickxia sp. NPDC080065 TaxID=3390568 RepID=UPI003CFCBF01
MLKCFLICCVLFVGVLMGMQKANVGMTEMKGYHDEGFKAPITIKEGNNGEVEASVLGKNVSSHDLEGKKEKIKEIKAFNFFSSLGKTIANIISGITEKIIDVASSLL